MDSRARSLLRRALRTLGLTPLVAAIVIGSWVAARSPAQATSRDVPGLVLVGRLVDEAGRLRPGFVRAFRGFGEAREQVAACDVGEDGAFELSFDEPGRVDLLAVATSFAPSRIPLADRRVRGEPSQLGAGTAAWLGVEPAAVPGEPLELRTRGPGVLRGRVVDDAGRPVPGLTVALQTPELAAATSAGERLELWLAGDGLPELSTTTDLDGRFEAIGARRGDFVVRAWRSSGPSKPVWRLGGGPLASDGVPRDMRLDRTPFVEVRVVRPDGSPWPATVSSDESWGEFIGGWASPSGAGRGPDALLVVLAELEPDPFARAGYPSSGWREGDAVRFAVETGDRYALGVRRRGQGWRPLSTVVVPPGADRIEAVLRVDDAPLGTLVLAVRDAEGEPVHGARIEVVDAATGLPIARPHRSQGPEPTRVDLPAGACRVVLEGRAWINHSHYVLVDPPRAGGFEAAVEIAPGRETRVDARLGEGARLRAAFRGTIREADRDAARAGRLHSTKAVESLAGTVELVLVTEGRPARPVLFPDPDFPAAPMDPRLDRTVTSELLMAGRYTLRARLPGGREVALPIELIDGKTTAVEVVFPDG